MTGIDAEVIVLYPDQPVDHDTATVTQGVAGERQVPDVKRTIVTAGGFCFNAQGCVLHRA